MEEIDNIPLLYEWKANHINMLIPEHYGECL